MNSKAWMAKAWRHHTTNAISPKSKTPLLLGRLSNQLLRCASRRLRPTWLVVVVVKVHGVVVKAPPVVQVDVAVVDRVVVVVQVDVAVVDRVVVVVQVDVVGVVLR